MSFKHWLTESEGKMLYIMRGPSGTGKSSTVMRLIKDGGATFSTDDYFSKDKEEYTSQMTRARKLELMPFYHQLNQDRVMKAMQQGISPIVVDNTNITKWAMKPYVDLGLQHKYEIRFVEPQSPQWEKIKKMLYFKDPEKMKAAAAELSGLNQHGIPPEAILPMLQNWHNDPKIEDFLKDDKYEGGYI